MVKSQSEHGAVIASVCFGVQTNYVRRHTYTSVEKANYINAELCLQSLPATLGLPGAVTIFDELQATHAIQAELVHGVVSNFDFCSIV